MPPPKLVWSWTTGSDWASFRSKCTGYDRATHTLFIEPPQPTNQKAEAGLRADAEIGVAFRRGHKKCLFVTQPAEAPGLVANAIRLSGSEDIRAVQRRAYQRVIVPPHRFIAAKLWEGGLPTRGEVCFPLCAGRLANVSVGGVMLDLRADQNPRLQVGDLVGIEITRQPGGKPLFMEGHYRHCMMQSAERIGLGFQFVGLEHDVPGRATLDEVAQFVSGVRRGV